MINVMEILSHEHRLIEQVLGSFETFANHLAEHQPGQRQTVRGYAEFFSTFANRCHDSKEEDLLFETLQRHGISAKKGGPLMILRQEHERGGALVQELVALGIGKEPLDSRQQERLLVIARQYVAFQRSHIMKEDFVLLPLALQTLPAAILAETTAAFERFEEEIMGKDVHAQMHTLAKALMAAYPPPR